MKKQKETWQDILFPNGTKYLSFWQQNPELFLTRLCELNSLKEEFEYGELEVTFKYEDNDFVIKVSGLENTCVSWVYEVVSFTTDTYDTLEWIIKNLNKQVEESKKLLSITLKWEDLKNKALLAATSGLTEEELKILKDNKFL